MNETIDNIALIYSDCAKKRHQVWQEQNSNAKIRPGDFIKVGIDTDNSKHTKEYLWLKVEMISDDRADIQCIVNNTPVLVSNLQCGDKIIVSRIMIEDYLPSNFKVI